MDKMLVIIIIFLAVTFTLAGILVMGAVPKIFQTSEKIDQTLVQQYEDHARDQLRLQIINETNHSLLNLENNLMDFIDESTERSIKGAEQRQQIIHSIAKATNGIENLTGQILNLTKSDSEGASEHRNSTNIHHEKLLELGNKIDENIIANMTKKGISPN